MLKVLICVLLTGCLGFGSLACEENKSYQAKSGEPESPTCKEKIKIIVPEGGYMELECDARQVAEILDKPMPGAQHAQWVVRCACPKAPAPGSPL